MTSHLRHGVSLSCDRLESRENPAGNVVALIGGDGALYLRGDAAANLASVQQSAAGDLYVFGRSGTTVNGQASVYLGRAFVSGVSVVADAGADLIEIINLRTAGGIGVLAGDENDGVALYGVECARLNLLMQGGDDTVVTDGVYAVNGANVDGGSGSDTIDFRTLGITTPSLTLPGIENQVGGPTGNVAAWIGSDGALYLRGDAAANLVSVQQNAAGDLYIFGRGGNTVNGQASVYLGRGFVSGVSIVADDGNDLFEIIGLRTAGGIGVLAGNENDSVALYGVECGWLNLVMQGGDDVVVSDGVYAASGANIDGGTGFDTVDYRTYGITTPWLTLPGIEKQVGGQFGY
jgi:hypothetical protein